MEIVFLQIERWNTCHKIYEDKATLAFLDISPVKMGMFAIPKEHHANIWNSREKFIEVVRTVKQSYAVKASMPMA